jgi:3-phenylpropionate/cinnamic acid dioxygenase small subunit
MTDTDVLELNRLVYRYAAAVDALDTAEFVGVFHPDARFRVYNPQEDEPIVDYVGAEQLAIVMRDMGEMYRCTAHQMTNHLVDVSGDTASGTVLATARHLKKDPSDNNVLIVVIRYVDRYERRDGEWRIADREIRQLWSERTLRIDSEF